MSNEVIARLRQAAIEAHNAGCEMIVTDTGILIRKPVVEKPNVRRWFSKRVSFEDIEMARINPLLIVIKEAVEEFWKGEPE